MTHPTFDPCKQWLGIDAVDLGDPRRVLGLPPGELDAPAIVRAAVIKLSLLQSVAPGAFAMAHAALVQRVTEARDALLAEAAAAGPPRFSMPPPPPGAMAAPPAAPPPVPPGMPPAVPSVVPPAGPSTPSIAPAVVVRARHVPRYSPPSTVGPVLLLVVAGLGAVAGVMAYRAREDRLARQSARDKPLREVAFHDVDLGWEPPPAVVPRRAAPSRPPSDGQPEDEVSTSPPPMEQERRNEARRARLERQSREPVPPAPPPPVPSQANGPAEPPAEPAMDEAPARDVEDLLAEAFTAMQRQEFAAAKTALQAARRETADRTTRDRIASFEELADYAEKFSGFRDQALAAVRSGIEYDIPTAKGSRKIAIVEFNHRELIYREAGRNNRWPRDRIPAAVITHIVRKWFDERPENHLFLGAYFATKPEPDRENARAEWMTAKKGGVDVSSVLPILEDPLLAPR